MMGTVVDWLQRGRWGRWPVARRWRCRAAATPGGTTSSETALDIVTASG